MNFIILGDKFQKRMKSKGCVGLIKTNNKPILHQQYSVIKQTFPKSKIVYVYGFEGKKFLSFIDKNHDAYKDLIPVHNPEYDNKNTAYSLYLASKYLNDECIILFGDHILHKKSFTHFKPTQQSQIFINRKQKNKLGCIINHNKIENIAYDLDNYLSEIYYISKRHSTILKDSVNDMTNHNCFLFELINKIIDNNQDVVPRYVEYTSKSLIQIKK